MSEFLSESKPTVQDVLDGKITDEEFFMSLDQDPIDWAEEQLNNIAAYKAQMEPAITAQNLTELQATENFCKEILNPDSNTTPQES